MTVARRKAYLKGLLADQNWAGLRTWVIEERSPLRILLPLFHDNDPLIRQRTVEALRCLSAEKAETNLEYLRNLVRRLFWTMNDESGNHVRMAPEAIGEILVNAKQLISEYIKQLFSFIEEEPFQRGVHRAIARIAEVDPTAVRKYAGRLAVSLDSPDPYIRSSAIMALKHIDITRFYDKIGELSNDQTEIEIYDYNSGEFQRITVGEIAASVVRFPT